MRLLRLLFRLEHSCWTNIFVRKKSGIVGLLSRYPSGIFMMFNEYGRNNDKRLPLGVAARRYGDRSHG